jgi:beta-glucosidase
MFIYRTIVNNDGSLSYDPASGPVRMHALGNIDKRNLSHFNIGDIPEVLGVLATWQNNLQKYAEQKTRLGIPVTIASDPRLHFSTNIYAFSGRAVSSI